MSIFSDQILTRSSMVRQKPRCGQIENEQSGLATPLLAHGSISNPTPSLFLRSPSRSSPIPITITITITITIIIIIIITILVAVVQPFTPITLPFPHHPELIRPISLRYPHHTRTRINAAADPSPSDLGAVSSEQIAHGLPRIAHATAIAERQKSAGHPFLRLKQTADSFVISRVIMDGRDHFSTVLQRPPHFDEDGSNGHGSANEDRGPRGGLRDILNPVSSASQPAAASALGPPGTPGAPAPPRPHSSFSLRSPTQGDYHTPNPYSTSPGSHPSGSRSILSNPVASALVSASSFPPPPPPPPLLASTTTLQAPQAIASPLTTQHLPPVSPLHAPHVYYSSEIRDRDNKDRNNRDPVREKSAASSSFYDPTADSTKKERERRVSDTGSSWRNATQSSTPKARDSYNYSQPSDYYTTNNTATPTASNHQGSIINGASYASHATSSLPPRSPISQYHPAPGARSISPSAPASTRLRNIKSPSPRHSQMPTSTINGTTPTALPVLARSGSPTPSSKTQGASGTPSRAAGVMSFSNILSEPVSNPRATSPTPIDDTPIRVESGDTVEKADREKKPRKGTKSRVSEMKGLESTPKASRKATSKPETLASGARLPAKRLANGHTKQKSFSADKEKRIQEEMNKIDVQSPQEEDFEFEFLEFQRLSKRRRLELGHLDLSRKQLRRTDFAQSEAQKLKLHADLGKRRFDDLHYDEALQEVRQREIQLEKERKKDMQRKRRREKSMALTLELKNSALKRATIAQSEAERLRYMKEAERAEKKVQQTKYILQNGLKGPPRSSSAIEPNLEGGTMATFQAENMEPGKAKGKGRAGGRLKKSKEQKQAEKDSAEAAQAALDAGKELPTKEETSKIRLKITKQPATDSEKDKENKEPKESKKEKVVEDPKDLLETRFQSKGFNQIYDQIWRDLARKDVNKVFRLATDSYSTKASNLKKTAILASKEAKRWQLRTNKGTKDLQARAKRVMRDMMGFWKRNEREERDLRKAAEKQELENARKEEADREAARQKRKLNFLISQTELYSHFIGKKIKTNEVERSTDRPEIAETDQHQIPETSLDIEEPAGPVGSKVTNFENLDFDDADETTLKAAAMANAQNAIAEAQKKAREFNKDTNLDEDGEMNFQNPTGMGDVEIEQPKLLNCQLKEYQLKGLNWLVNLYEQGINGILADEMGLGKTVQSISVMAYLAEKYDIWGPFLVVAPASTLHNWQQEITKFVPQFKVLPYWGTAADRKVLRKFWDRKHTTYKKDAAFHVMITSYQLVVSDVAYFQKMKWQYMILDEAQAIKSSQSSRWKCLLGFHCRNRLLLTGTPIQNNMQELWALLHFIMPSLFDSHDEFSEWFSKDIESHAQSNTKLNEDQLKRLHMILKPFMLRRVKKHVQKELGDKIELDVFCDLTYRQRALYASLRNQISILDLIEKATMGDDDSSSLMNLVMQFRKVCNHPDLFERADTKSPFSCGYFAETASFVREGTNVSVGYSVRSLIDYDLPRLVWRDDGRLDKPGPNNAVAGFRKKYTGELLNIWTPANIRDSIANTDNFSWLRFADTSPQEAYKASHQGLFDRAVALSTKKNRLGNMNVLYRDTEYENWTPVHVLFQVQERADRKPLADITEQGVLRDLMNVARTNFAEIGLGRLEQAGRPRASAPPIEVSCTSRAAVVEREHVLFNPQIRKALYGPTPVEEKALVAQKIPIEWYPPPALLPAPDKEKSRFTNIAVPSMRRFITDSGKLAKLDELLRQLKEGGHRVLLYFQMTRMIDLMEEYLTYCNYKYCRLDGSTKLEDRRDTVSDFQTRPEIFIFLLSTRAGGLGINLTTADTVIFYDSDWNPTIDSQAMDRAHRLGQTKQVTVYRLITRGTIEERIRKRAMQKEEVQRVVITGGSSAAGGGVDFSGRRAPENRNRDIAMWLADDEQAELIERREKELLESGEYDKIQKKRGGKRKRGDAPTSLDEMYHEGRFISSSSLLHSYTLTNIFSTGEGHFDDNKGSGTATGTATPNAAGAEAADGRPGKRKRVTGGKKAKTTKQRLAIADGEIDI
ncbi:putative DNA helicase ino-80 [Triangularia setosa]|uniref:Chromatin-remodeling ATPase INO80 n=1 Tax=Triangularia setosa TaxID=2587417 RepID=A0AAN6WGS9_9PEZI|nr:putative DNA helicase ino-80 [Podospora setosa]